MDRLNAGAISVPGVDVRVVERCASTNTVLLAEPLRRPTLLAADEQSAGRGRRGRRWHSPPGCGALFSLGLPLARPARGLAGLSIVAGVAAVRALRALGAAEAALKWPNDLMLGDAKLAGILIERSGERVVAGFGVNLAGAPAISGRKIASLGSLADLDPKAFAPIIAGSFARVLSAWRIADPVAFAIAWMARAHPVGTSLEVHSGPGERISGMFDGIEPDGAMRLRLADGRIELVRAGDVSLAISPPAS